MSNKSYYTNNNIFIIVNFYNNHNLFNRYNDVFINEHTGNVFNLYYLYEIRSNLVNLIFVYYYIDTTTLRHLCNFYEYYNDVNYHDDYRCEKS